MIFDYLVAVEIFEPEKILRAINQCLLGQCADDFGADHSGSVSFGFKFDNVKNPVNRRFISIEHVHGDRHPIILLQNQTDGTDGCKAAAGSRDIPGDGFGNLQIIGI